MQGSMTRLSGELRSPERVGAVLVLCVALLAIVGLTRPAMAIPAYARQTGQTCASCHTGLLELAPQGREFKLNGYVQGGGLDTWYSHFAGLVQTGFTRTQK